MNKHLIPQLSKDITYYPFGDKYFFIHHEILDHRVKISLELYNFLGLIDGKKNLEYLINEYNSKFKSFLTTDFADDFLFNKLAKFGVIESNTVEIKPNEKPDYLKLSFIVFNDKVVSEITRYLKYLFIEKVLKIVLILILGVLITCNIVFYEQMLALSIGKTEWMFFLIMSFVGVTFHEFGHVSAADYYGAKHGGIGGGFYLLMPVYYADVTDIWKLPKSQRISVNLAGMYFEFIYAVFLLLIGILFQYKLLILLVCIYSTSILRNLNPFARSDGYWVLSDSIEKPNLMYHGFQKVKQVFRSKKEWKRIDYFLLFYGLCSYSFIALFIYFVVVKNPDSILYFPQNLWHFCKVLFEADSKISLEELGKLFVPILFFYLSFKWLKLVVIKRK